MQFQELDYSFQIAINYYKRKSKIKLIKLVILVDILAIILSVITFFLGYANDFRIYHESMLIYQNGGNIFDHHKFVYLKYFSLLASPLFYKNIYVSYFLFLIVNIACIDYIIIKENQYGHNTEHWILGCFISIIYNLSAMNVDLIIAYFFVLYFRNIDNKWSPIYLIFILFKPTTIIILPILLLIKLLRERRIDYGHYIVMIIVGIFIFYNFIESANNGLLENIAFMDQTFKDSGQVSFLRFSHLIWLLYPLKILLEENQRYNKAIWAIIMIVGIIMGLTSIILGFLHLDLELMMPFV